MDKYTLFEMHLDIQSQSFTSENELFAHVPHLNILKKFKRCEKTYNVGRKYFQSNVRLFDQYQFLLRMR